MLDSPTVAAGPVPLSYAQEQLWFIENLSPAARLYNELWQLRLDGDLDVGLLGRALDAVAERHESLRATFPTENGAPVCRYLTSLSLATGPAHDLAHLPEDQRRPAAERIAREFADRPYDIAAGPLTRSMLLRLGPREHLLLIGCHHLVADGQSLTLIRTELDELMTAELTGRPPALPPPAARFADHVARQRAALAGGERSEGQAYWRDRLAGAPVLLDLHKGRLRPAVKSEHGERARFDLDPASARGLLDFAMRESSTPACVLIAAFAAVAHRHTGDDDLIIGTAGAGRSPGGFDDVVGFFANTLPLRLRPRPASSFRNLLAETTEAVLDALEFEEVPFTSMVEGLTGRDPSIPPLVQVMVTQSPKVAHGVPFGPVRATEEQIPRGRARFDLLIEAEVGPGDVTLWVEYDDALFEAAYVRTLIRHLEAVLRAGCAEPELELGRLPMLGAGERSCSEREVLIGDCVAPDFALGRLHRAGPGGRIDDVLVPPGPDTGRVGYRRPGGVVVDLGPADRFPVIGGITVPLDEVAALPPDAVPRYASAAVRQSGGEPDVGDPPGLDTVRPALLALWRRELGNPGYGPHDDVFEHGGHSMMVARLALLARDELGLEAPIRAIFEHPTVDGLARLICRGQPDAVQTLQLLAGLSSDELDALLPAAAEPAAADPGPAPLTGAQRQIWVMEQLAPGAPTYNIPLEFDLTGTLDPEALAAAFAAVIARHDALRCRYEWTADGPVQQVVPGAGPELEVHDLTGLGEQRALAAADRMAREQAASGFDLRTEPPVRAQLVVAGPTRARLLVVFHHIGVDEVGLYTFRRDLVAAYRAARDGLPAALPAPALAWTEYARWERDWLAGPAGDRQRDYWAAALRGVPELRLRTDLVAPEGLSFAGGHYDRVPSVPLMSAVRTLGAELSATPFVVFAAACAVLLSRESGQQEFVVGAPAENRQRADAHDLVGCSVNVLALRVRVPSGATFAEVVAGVREVTIDAYDNQGLPLPEVVRLIGARRAANRLPLVQVTVAWQDGDDINLDLPGCASTWRYVSSGASRYDISYTAMQRGDELELGAEYNTALWHAESIDAQLATLERILVGAAAAPATAVSELG
ncbi:condensation domain-containing protein [Plantactinospora sp. DSM 117369]